MVIVFEVAKRKKKWVFKGFHVINNCLVKKPYKGYYMSFFFLKFVMVRIL